MILCSAFKFSFEAASPFSQTIARDASKSNQVLCVCVHIKITFPNKKISFLKLKKISMASRGSSIKAEGSLLQCSNK